VDIAAGGGQDSILQFLFGGDADVAQHGACELGEEASTRLSQVLVIVENEHVDFAVDAGRRKKRLSPRGAQ
jgi:hypothetical protein